MGRSSALLALLGMVAGVCMLFNLWFSKEEQQAFVQRGVRFVRQLREMGPTEHAQAPLVGVKLFCDAILGQETWAWKPLLRIALLSVCLLIGGFGATMWITGQPPLTAPPWVTFENTLDVIVNYSLGQRWQSDVEKICAEQPAQCEVGEPTREVMERYRPIVDYVVARRAWYWKWIYSVTLVIGTLLLTATFNAVTFSIARSLVRGVLHTENRALRTAALIVNVLVAAVLSTIAVVVITIVATPWTWLLVGGAVFFSALIGPVAASFILPGLFVIVSLAAWALAGAWIKVVALTTIVPALMLILAELVGYFLPYVAPLATRLVLNVLERGAAHENGFLAFVATASTALAVIVGALAHFLP